MNGDDLWTWHRSLIESELRWSNHGMECPIEAVVRLCPGLTWNQVFLAIHHLSRTAQVRVTFGCRQDLQDAALPSSGVGACLPVVQHA